MPNISADLNLRNSYLKASQMVVEILENVNKDHENLNHMAASENWNSLAAIYTDLKEKSFAFERDGKNTEVHFQPLGWNPVNLQIFRP